MLIYMHSHNLRISGTMLVFFMIYFLSFPLKAALGDCLFSHGLSGYLAIEKEREQERE